MSVRTQQRAEPAGYHAISAPVREFLGYGNPAARLWFVGMEEGTRGDDGHLAHQLAIRTKFQRTMDLEDAQRQLGHDLRDSRTLVWRFMAKIARGWHERATDWRAGSVTKEYLVSGPFGRTGGPLLLAELLPLPRPRNSVWPAAYAAFAAKRADYEEAALEQRIPLLCGALRTSRPRLVIGYGRKYWNQLERLARADSWTEVELSRPARVMRWVDVGPMTFLMLPFLGQGHFGNDDVECLLRELEQRGVRA